MAKKTKKESAPKKAEPAAPVEETNPIKKAALKKNAKFGVIASDEISSKFSPTQKFSIQRNRGWRGGSGKP